jgi:thiamine-monophosphate kinase
MKKEPLRPLGELALIERIRRGSLRAKNSSVALGIGDDCAILRPATGCELLVTTDFSLEGRHFLRDRHPPESVGHRCLARGLSDLAAMGGTPLAAFLSLALPAAMLSSPNWIDRFFAGLNGLGDRYNITLAGGDTSESPCDRILADIVLVGSAPRGRSLRRSGAQSGDALYLTGTLGGASAELESLLRRGSPLRRITETTGRPHLFPEPRLPIGQALLRGRLATAAIDISDGLSTDLTHLCRASKLRAQIDETALPIHPLAKKLFPEKALRAALDGGEDYELLFAASSSTRIPRAIAGVSITRIGTLKPLSSKHPVITLIQADHTLRALQPGGWEHFACPR